MNNLDLVTPHVYWIQDHFGVRCYRRNTPAFSSSSRPESRNSTPAPSTNTAVNSGHSIAPRLVACGAYYDGDDPPCGEIEDNAEEYDIMFDDKRHTFLTRVPIAKEYHKHIIGRQAETRKRLENQTKTHIDVPKIGQEGDVLIKGTTRESVASCRRRIEMIVDSARQRQPFTHFISFPFNSEEIIKNFTEFKRQVMEKYSDCRGVDESIFQIPERLHLTVGMLVLYSNLERTHAKETLERCKMEVIMSHLEGIQGPLKVRLKGLNYMNDDPSEVHVLYASVELLDSNNINILQTLSNKIVDYFVQNNVMPKKQYDVVKLHVTVMNTRYRSIEDDGAEEEDANGNGPGPTDAFPGRNVRNGEMEKRESFDARKILEEFRRYDFGVHELKEMHISGRYARRVGSYYPCTAKVDLS